MSYYKIQQAKLACYPPKNNMIITETISSIDLQAILDLTSERLLTVCEQNLDRRMNLKLICKWGFDGASNQSTYKQKFLNENVTDDAIMS